MSGDFLYNVSEWIIEFVFFGLMLASVETGFRLGRKAQATTPEKTKGQVMVLAGSVLGVLGLLLAFTISMAVSRYEVRKRVVLDEANAIGTSWLRTTLLPRPEGDQIARLLTMYVDARVRFGNTGGAEDRIQEAREESRRLQGEFWPLAVAYGREDPNPVRAGLLLQSLNSVIDLEADRWLAYHDHVPENVIFVIAMVAVLATMLLGLAFGLEGRRQMFSICLLSMAITVVLGVIVDLDRPFRGFIRAGQQPMLDLQQQVHGKE